MTDVRPQVVGSRQLAPAAKPNVLFGFQLHHRQQVVEHFEFVATGKIGKAYRGLRNQGRRLLRAIWQVCQRVPTLARRRALLPPRFPASSHLIPRNIVTIPSMRAQPLDGILQPLRY